MQEKLENIKGGIQQLRGGGQNWVKIGPRSCWMPPILMFVCGKGEITKSSECPITVRNLEIEVLYQLTQ